MDYSYKCLKAKNVRSVGTVGSTKVVLVDLVFEDEHGHLLAPANDTLVAIVDGENASMIVKDVCDILEEDCDGADWDRWSTLCDLHPGPSYDVYNPEEFTALLLAEKQDEPAELLAVVTSDMVHDADNVPTYEDKSTTFYWGAWPDNPVLPNVRVWSLFNKRVSEQDAIQIVKEHVVGP